MKFFFASMLFVIIQPACLLAEENSLEFSGCLDRAAGVTSEMLACITDEKERQDARLNRAYKKLMKDLPPERGQALKEAQRAWLKFRDSYADFLENKDGGTINIVLRADWLRQSTADQADLLEAELPQ